MLWYRVVWCGMVWYGVIWYGMVWYSVVWCGMACERTIASSLGDSGSVGEDSEDPNAIVGCTLEGTGTL